MSNYSGSNVLEELTNYEAGGQGLADDPKPMDQPNVLKVIESRSVGGSSEAIVWFRSALLSPQNPNPRMLFFVGAPGNGKSHLSRSVCEGFPEIQSRPLGRHYRDYHYHLPIAAEFQGERRLLVVNDATPRGDSRELGAPLLRDIRNSSLAGRYLQANVNKGILYREIHEASVDDEFVPILRWLNGDLKESVGNLEVRPHVANSSIRSASFLSSEGMNIEIVAVQMDMYSLFEKQPRVVSDAQGVPEIVSEQGGRYEISSFRSSERSTRKHWKTIPAGELLSGVIGSISLDKDFDAELVDPIRSNVQNLQGEAFFTGVLTFMRAAELATNRHFSFRDLWTTAALVVLGEPSCRTSDNLGPQAWVRRNQPPVQHGRERLASLCRLGALRLHQSICGSNWSPLSETSSFVPSQVAQNLRQVDPCRDSLPGVYSPNRPNAGWATPILDSFRGQDDGDSILAFFESNALTLDNQSQIVTEFDRILDREVTYCLGLNSEGKQVLSLKEQHDVLTWYGEYLTRLFAVSHGISAYRNEIDVYVTAWMQLNNHNANIEQSLDNSLAEPIINLILPSFQNTGGQPIRLITVLAPRTRSILEPSLEPRLAYCAPAGIYVSGQLDGDLMEIVLREQDGNRSELLRLNLDFAILREALNTTRNTQGMTEMSQNATPRIERFRASMIKTSDLSQKLVVLRGDSQNRITLG